MVDSRLGFTPLDLQLLEFVGDRIGNGAVKMLVLLTKSDKHGKVALAAAVEAAGRVLAERITGDAADVSVAPFSALNRSGVADAAKWLYATAHPDAAAP